MILIIGATSQVGIILVKNLIEQGYKVRCLVRKTSNTLQLEGPGIQFTYGDVEDYNSVTEAVKGVEAIVHIAGIWRIDALLKACSEQNFTGKAIFIGSTSRFKKLDSIDQTENELAHLMSKAEESIKNSGLNYVILRPTMLYGIDLDKNILQIISFMRSFRFYPLIGSGNALKQPVYVEDVANAVISCIKCDKIIKKDYIIGGSVPIKHKDILYTIKRNLPFKAFILRVPIFAGYMAVFIYKLIKPSTYINYAMIKRVNENIIYDINDAVRDFGYAPVDFETGVKRQIGYLNKKGII